MEDTPAAVCHSGVEKTVMKVRCEFLQSDSLREEVSYKDSELMEQCNTDKTPNNPHAGTV